MEKWGLVRRRTSDDLFSMRHEASEVLLEYSNGDDKLPIEYPNRTSEK